VERPLSATIALPAGPGEVGRPADVTLRLQGGVPPISVTVRAAGQSNGTTLDDLCDGPQVVAIVPTVAGAFSMDVNVTDAVGVENTSVADLEVDPPLVAQLASNESLEGGVSSIAFATELTGGIPPYLWAVDAPNLVNSSAPFAGVANPGTAVAWSGLFDPESAGPVNETVIDAAGSNVTVGVIPLHVPALGGNVSIRAGPPGTVDIGINLTGGVPPYSLWANLSGGGSWTLTPDRDGESSWAIATRATGPCRVSVIVIDRYDHSLGANATVGLEAVGGPTAPSPIPIPIVAIGLGALGGIGLGGFLYRRRRAARYEPAPSLDPTAVLRRILEPADGADRSTVELLAEEAGIPLAEVRATIDRLVESGAIRSETSTEGEEVLAWSGEAPP